MNPAVRYHLDLAGWRTAGRRCAGARGAGPGLRPREWTIIDEATSAAAAATTDQFPPVDGLAGSGGRRSVVLVDVEGNEIGSAEKLAAHQPPGQLHLAFSVFLYRFDGKLLVQQRAASKYHFPLLWANSCCSHPSPGEDVVASAQARVREELGYEVELSDVGTIVYRAECAESGLVEHELDHVLVGSVEGEPSPDPSEVADVAWLGAGQIFRPAGGLRRAPWLVPALLVAERGRAASRAPAR